MPCLMNRSNWKTGNPIRWYSSKMFKNTFFLWCQLVLVLSTAYVRTEDCKEQQESCGSPLFLTPLLEKNEIERARNLASVEPFLGDFKSYAGFFTVNKTYDSNYFSWFFPAPKAAHTAPLMVMLAGGPGTSSMIGVLGEHGPWAIAPNASSVYLREYPWTDMFSLLYVDNPVGAGYSFTKHDQGYCPDEECVARNLYETLTQFYKMFPEFAANELYIHGISYGGKYAPALAYAIHQHNKVHSQKINLKGVAIANGFSDPVNMLDVGALLYQIGLIDAGEKQVFEKKENEIAELITAGKMGEAYEKFSTFILNETDSYYRNVTGMENYYNYLHSTTVYVDYPVLPAKSFLMLNSTRRRLHVGNSEFASGKRVEEEFKFDFMASVKPWIQTLLGSDIDFLFYNGALDVIVGYPLTENFLRKLDWSGAEAYRKAPRYIWRVKPNDTEVAGYVRTVRNLKEAMVRNAGHVVCMDQPRSGYDLIKKFVFKKL